MRQQVVQAAAVPGFCLLPVHLWGAPRRLPRPPQLRSGHPRDGRRRGAWTLAPANLTSPFSRSSPGPWGAAQHAQTSKKAQLAAWGDGGEERPRPQNPLLGTFPPPPRGPTVPFGTSPQSAVPPEGSELAPASVIGAHPTWVGAWPTRNPKGNSPRSPQAHPLGAGWLRLVPGPSEPVRLPEAVQVHGRTGDGRAGPAHPLAGGSRRGAQVGAALGAERLSSRRENDFF